jgi:hypothetical protein
MSLGLFFFPHQMEKIDHIKKEKLETKYYGIHVILIIFWKALPI